jgi:hypothetical protein
MVTRFWDSVIPLPRVKRILLIQSCKDSLIISTVPVCQMKKISMAKETGEYQKNNEKQKIQG